MELMAPQQESVPAGYKRTEIGVIPEDWEVMKAGDLGTFRGGSGFPLSFQGSPEGEFPFFKVSDMNLIGNEIRMDVANNYVSDGVRKRLQATVFPPNTIVFAKVGAAVFLERKKLLSRSSCLDNNMAGFIPDCTSVDIRFLHYSFLSLSFGSLVSTTALPSLGNGVLRDIKVSLPPTKAEQEAIAKALSDADAWIASLEQLIQKKRQIKQGAMQSLLTGKRRLPGFSGKWEERRLGDQVRFLRTGAFSRSQLNEEGAIRYLHYGDIHTAQNCFLKPGHTPMPYLPEALAKPLDRLSDGDLIFADASEDIEGVGKSVEISGVAGKEVVSGLHTIAARFDKTVLTDGFKAYLQFLPSFTDQLRRLAAGTKVYATTRTHIGSIELTLPSAPEQTAIATVLSDMDAEIEALETKLSKARKIKQGMMQELLTGRRRLEWD